RGRRESPLQPAAHSSHDVLAGRRLRRGLLRPLRRRHTVPASGRAGREVRASTWGADVPLQPARAARRQHRRHGPIDRGRQGDLCPEGRIGRHAPEESAPLQVGGGPAPVKIITWLWFQTPNRHGYDADKVNVWAANLRRKSSEPLELAVVTDHPEGIDPSIEIIRPPGLFEDVRIDAWKEANLAPQCFRRLAMFAPDAWKWIGADEWVCMDLDVCMGERMLDGLFVPGTDFRIMNGTSSKRPYNGGLVQMRAGARAHVYHEFMRDPVRVATEARKLFVGSDQAVISMILGRGEKTFGPA